MRFNIANFTKDEIIKRWNFRCRHEGKRAHGITTHNGFEHPRCYERATNKGERIGFFDIEASNLNANFGITLSYAIKNHGGRILGRVLCPEELRKGVFDKDLMSEFCEDARKFDRLITYYGGGFDIPFTRTRCVHYKVDYPIYKEISHTDVYQIVRHKLCFHRNRMEVAAKFFGIKAKTHPMLPEIWIKCLSGDPKALKFVWTHNKEDVVTLEKLWDKVISFSRVTKTSI